jgi:starch phosphorylase
MSRDPELQKRLVFVEDYDIKVGRELVQGVDLWLNNPRRGEEACGTSGMKVGLNGILNLSILDGWFDEAYEVSGGWAIGDREPYSEDQDEIHASAIYSLLENEIVPMYYKDREEGVPVEWTRRIKLSLKNLSPRFNSQRMLSEYSSELYDPAHRAFVAIQENDYAEVKERAKWSLKVQEAWSRVRFVEISPDLAEPVVNGMPIPFRAVVDLSGLKPEDVRVEVVVGTVNVNGELQEIEVLALSPDGSTSAGHVFAKEYVPIQTGRLGYAVRVSPNHSDDPLTRPCHSLIRWGVE